MGSRRLEFRNSRRIAIFVAVVAGLIGSGFLLIGIAAFTRGGALFALLAPVLIGIALAFGFGRNVVTIDLGSRCVRHTWRWFDRDWTEVHPFRSFREIGVRSVGASNHGRVHYRVMLKGAASIYLPGETFGHSDDAVVFARDVAERMGVLVDETPRIGFFNH